jgi:hypothetical protein
VALDGAEGRRWYESNGDQGAYRIIRQASEFPNGCFRGAVALPAGARPEEVRALRFHAFTRGLRKGERPIPPGQARAAVRRVNRLFRLGADYRPEPDLFLWQGDLPLSVDGPPAEIAIPPGPVAR